MVQGILFDSGGVLLRPVGGRWNPRCDFEEIVLAHHPGVHEGLFPAAIAAGQKALDAAATTLNRAIYHRTMLSVLGVSDPSSQLLVELEAPAKRPALELFPDVRPVLNQLRAAGIRMAIVSDGWSGLEHLYRQLGIADYPRGVACLDRSRIKVDTRSSAKVK